MNSVLFKQLSENLRWSLGSGRIISFLIIFSRWNEKKMNNIGEEDIALKNSHKEKKKPMKACGWTFHCISIQKIKSGQNPSNGFIF